MKKPLLSIICLFFILCFVNSCKKNDVPEPEPTLSFDGDGGSGEFGIHGTFWTTCSLKWYFKNPTSDLSVNEQKQALIEAFKVWEDASGISFEEVYSSSTADILIGFGTSPHSDLLNGTCPKSFETNILAHAYFPPPNGPLAGDIHFNDYYDWKNDIDLKTVAIHELGHALGLEHSDIMQAIMYPSYQGVMMSLYPDDIEGITTIYPNCNGGGGGCPKVISLLGDLNFGSIQVNPIPIPSKILKISNIGTCPLIISNIAITTPFSTSFNGSITIQPNAFKDIEINFNPTSQGPFNGSIQVTSDATSGSNTIQVSGSASNIAQTKIISLSGDLNFGNVEVNTLQSKTFSIFNNGNSPLNISSIDYPQNSGFTGSPFSGNIQANTSQSLNVNFYPTSSGNFNSTITVNCNATSGSKTINCSGIGVSAQTRIINIAGDLNFGNINVNTLSSKTITIYNNGNSPLNISSIDYPQNSGFTGSPFSGNIQANTSQSLNVNFYPTSSGNFNSTITVNCNATSGSKIINCSGTGISFLPVSVSPSIGTYTNCPTNNIQCNSLLEGNVISFRVKTIDSQTGKITFEIKKCNGTNFLYPGYAYVNFSPCGPALNFGNFNAGYTTIEMVYQPSPSEMNGSKTYYCTLASTSGNIGAYHAGSITLSY